MAIKVGDLVFHSYAGSHSYGVLEAIEYDEYWVYFSDNGYRKTFTSLSNLTKVGPWCLGVWDERQ